MRLLLERVMDVLLAFPELILALAIASIPRPAVQNVMIAVAIPIIPRAARVARATALSVQLVCVVLFLPLTSLQASAGGGGIARHTGHIQSIRPSDGMLIIEELGTDGVSEVLAVWIQEAKVVRIWRDPADPWTWRERVTSIYRWPVGTFVVVTGRTIHDGSIEASRIEIPKIMSE